MKKRYVIIGGNAGGVGAAVRLRRLDENAEVTIFEKGSHVSFACCGLPYYLGGVVSKDLLMPESPGSFKQKYNIEVKVRSEVTGINRHNNHVTVSDLESGAVYSKPYDKLVLATGAGFKRASIPGADLPGVFTLKSMDDMLAVSDYIDSCHARRAAVIGGGTIGLETAENLSRRGIKTCVIELSDHVLPYLDTDIAQFAALEMENNGVALATRSTVKSTERTAEGLRLELTDGRFVCVDLVMLCTGVKPDVRLADKAGLGIGVTGGIIVDERQQTTDKNIYAVGDAVEVASAFGGKVLIPMASPAGKQGRIAADNICGVNSKYRHTIIVSVIKLFDIHLACAGLTETQLAERDIRYEKIYTRSYTHERFYPGADELTVKLLFEKRTGRVFGVQIAGRSGVDKRIDVFAAAMQAGMTVDRLAEMELGYTPPFGSAKDAVNMAGFAALDVMGGLSEVVQWHDIGRLENTLLLDVRSEEENRAGAIPDAVNIPFDKLRGRLDELPKEKDIVVYSQYGQRGYFAERMLRQHGFKIKNLTGGYVLYRIFTRNG